MSRTLVTGGAGFLGSHICEYLLRKGHEVVCMDNLLTGAEDNIAHLNGKGFSFVNHDVSKYIEIDGELNYITDLRSMERSMGSHLPTRASAIR